MWALEERHQANCQEFGENKLDFRVLMLFTLVAEMIRGG